MSQKSRAEIFNLIADVKGRLAILRQIVNHRAISAEQVRIAAVNLHYRTGVLKEVVNEYLTECEVNLGNAGVRYEFG